MGWKITMPSVVYAIRCTQNGKMYIGRTQDVERRMKEHLAELVKAKGGKQTSKAKHFVDDFAKYGEYGFEVYVLEQNVPPDRVLEREAYWIEEYKATDPNRGYNQVSGAVGRGFSCIKVGLPPKVGDREKRPLTIDEKFDLLTEEDKHLVTMVIEAMLKAREA